MLHPVNRQFNTKAFCFIFSNIGHLDNLSALMYLVNFYLYSSNLTPSPYCLSGNSKSICQRRKCEVSHTTYCNTKRLFMQYSLFSQVSLTVPVHSFSFLILLHYTMRGISYCVCRQMVLHRIDIKPSFLLLFVAVLFLA